MKKKKKKDPPPKKRRNKSHIKRERKQRSKANNEIIYKMHLLVEKYGSKIPLNELTGNLSWNKIKTFSFYDMRIAKFDKFDDTIEIKQNVSELDKIIKCKKITLLPTDEQKKNLLQMFDAYRIMYNETNRFIKSVFHDKKMRLPNWKSIRTNYLMDIKNRLCKQYNVYSHTLDGAIKLCYTAYKSCFTNLRNHNIKHFRIRYIKKDKDSQIMDIEKVYCQKEHLFKQYIKDIMKNNEDFDYSTVSCDAKIHYNGNTGRFTLLVPEVIKEADNKYDNEYISIDPGIRTFLTCISNDKVIEIGRNVSSELKMMHTKIDNYNDKKKKASKIKNRIKQLKITRLREKIKNKVSDMHWKIINYLKRFKNIVIGKWSTKDIISNKSSILKSMNKRIAQSLCFYQFLMKLEYKSKVYSNNVVMVDERYTSKMCSHCGNIKEDLGGNKKYECEKCKIVIDRDINSARNILIKNNIA